MIEAVGKSWRNPNLCEFFFFVFLFLFSSLQQERRRGYKSSRPGGEAAKRQRRLCPGLWVLSRGRGAAAGEGRVKSSFCASEEFGRC